MKKVAYFLSHPIQYQTPLLQKLAKEKTIDIEVVYFTDHTIGGLDKQFGIEVNWDIPLLEGYKYTFLKNYALAPAVSGKFWGLVNWGIIRYLIKNKPDVAIIHGWAYFSSFLLLITGNLLGVKIIMRAETPLQQINNKGKLNQITKRIILKLCDKFLYIGKENKAFYKFLGVREHQLFYAPYCVDNERFTSYIKSFSPYKDDIRKIYNIPNENKIGVYCGKLISIKRPLDLLKALKKINSKNITLLLIGTGELETEMKKYIAENNIKNIVFAGFVNQTQLYKYYMSSDFFILPSASETWGLAANEAMLYSLPLLLSNKVGCASDLVIENENGFVFKCGNIDELSEKIEKFSSLSENKLNLMGKKSFEIVQKYNFDEVMNGFIKAIQ